MDLKRIESALSHALGSSLGARMKPVSSGDVTAIQVLDELRAELGIKTATSPVVVVEKKALEDL